VDVEKGFDPFDERDVGRPVSLTDSVRCFIRGMTQESGSRLIVALITLASP